MKYNPLSRRHFLQGLGGLTLALPILESLAPLQAYGASPVKRRFIAIKTDNGQRKMYWTPNLPANVQMTQVAPHQRVLPLSTFNSTGINQVLGTAFVPYHGKMNFFEGLDFVPPVGHNQGGMLGNFNDTTPTIDQVLAKSPKVYGYEPAIRSLLLGSQPAGSSSFSFDVSNGNLVNLPSYVNMQAAFDRIFYSANPAQKSRYGSIVDAVFQDYKNLKSHKRLSASDRTTLDRHMTGIQELNSRLKTSPPLTCPGTPARPAQAEAGLSLAEIENYYKNMTDLVALAIMCGATQIATIEIAHPKTYGGSTWHSPSHDRENEPVPILLEINQWIAQKIVLELAKKLDVPESDGKTYLDNSAILWGNEISIGWSHISVNMPTVMLGSMGGTFKTGNYLSYIHDSKTPAPTGEQLQGRPYNQLLVSILQGMGLSAADYQAPGTVGYGVSTCQDPTRAAFYSQFNSQVGNPLPGLYLG